MGSVGSPSWGAFSLLLIVVLRGAWEWRYVDRFLDDHGWYLRVAERVAAGEMLYRDVGWVYGPLPVYVLALLFRISKTLVWAELLDLVLAGAAVWAVFVIARHLGGRRSALWLASWAAFLGAAKGLLSFHLEAYTSAVAWGAATSLLAAAAASGWVAGRGVATLAAAVVAALASVLSKPEFGLAGASVLACAVIQRRPPRIVAIAAVAVAAAAAATVARRATPATLHACWRGYSGYDLIAVGQVPLADARRLLGALLASAILALSLWSGVVRVGAVALVAIFVVYRSDGTSIRFLLELASAGASVVWVGVVPALLWLGWKTRRAVVAREIAVVCTYAVAVNLRPFLYGDFCPVVAGPVAALALYAVRHRIVLRPPRWGLAVLAIVALLIPVHEEVRSLQRPRHAEPVETTLGVARVPTRAAAEIRELRAVLDPMPAGPLFVSGAGPGWYLVSA